MDLTGILGDANVSLATAASSPGFCSVNNLAHSFTCLNLSISNGAAFTVTFTGTTIETTGKQQILTVSAAVAPHTVNDFAFGTGSVPSNSNNSLNVQPHANIATVFTTAPSDPFTFVPPPASASHTYIIKATNNGPDVIASSVLSGAFPNVIAQNQNVTINIISVTAGSGSDACTFTPTTYSCTIGSFATGAGASHSFTVVADVSLNSGSASGLVTNSVLGVGPVNAGDFVNDNAALGGSSASARILGSANLTLSFSGSASPVLVGNSFVYTATVSNAAGASDAAGVQVTIPLNSLLPGQVATGFSGQGSCSGTTTIVCTMGAAGVIAANNSATVQITVSTNSTLVPDSGTGLPALVTFSAGPPRSVTFLQSATVSVDPAQTINSNAANATQKTNSTFQAAAHITVAHTNSTAPALIDSTGTTYGQVIYTTTVTNAAGRSDAQNVVITDTPPIGPNVNFVSANFAVNAGPNGACSGPTSGKVICQLPLLASGNTATITITLQPIRSATMPPASITDTVSYTSSDVTDPTPSAGGLTDSSTIAVQNTVSNGTLPLQALSSLRTVQLHFGTVSTTGVTQFDTTPSFAGLTLPSLYPLSAQPGQSLLYVFSTTAISTAPVTFCFDSVQTFAKPERVRMFLLSAGAPLDITSSIAPPAPTQLTGISQVCGTTAFSGGTVMLAIFEPKNNAPVLNASSVTQTNINPAQGITGQIVLEATPTTDQDTNPCNGSQTTNCSDTLQYVWTTATPGGFTAVNGTSLTGSTTPSIPLNQNLYNSGIFLPLGRGQSVTLAVNDQLNATTTKTFTVDVLNTAAGNNQVVIPVDRQNPSFGNPATVTFASVGVSGITTLPTAPTVPLPPFPITVPNTSDPSTPHHYVFGQNGVTTVYQLATDATVSGTTQICINLAPNQTFIKPNRVRMFLLSNFSGSDITTSISPAVSGAQPTSVCGAVLGFGTASSPTLVAILEPMNEAPEVKNSAIQQVNINPRQGVTGELLLDATSAIDPDTDLCNGGGSTCMDTLNYLWTGSPSAFTDQSGVTLGAPTAPLNQKLYGGGIFLPIGRNQTVTLAITDQLGVTTTKAFPLDVNNTPVGSLINVNPVDGRILAKGTPLSITFSNVSSSGVTTLDTMAGQLPPSRFRFGANGSRYNVVSDAVVSGSTQVCVDTSQQRFVKPERVRLFELSPTFADITTSITPVPTIPSKGQVVNQVCGVLAGYTTGTMQLAVLEPVNNAPVVGLTFNLSSSQDAGKGVTGNFVDLNPGSTFDPDTDSCNGGATKCADSPQVRFFIFGPFPGALQSNALNPIVRNISLPGGTSTITVAALDQTVTIQPNVTIASPADLMNLTDGVAQNGLTITQFAVTIDSATPGGSNVTTATILAGQSASFIFSPQNPNGGPIQGSGTLSLTCSNGPTTPSLDSLHITCGITPTTFTIGSSSAPALLISTTGATLGQAQPAPGAPLYAAWIAFAGMPFAGIVIISGFGPGRRRRWLKLLLAFGLLVVAIGSQVACGGGSMKPTSPSFATPRGNYEIVVTGSQNGTALSKNSFTITVQ
ncbi:MAG TPA: hypothetical protein VF493_15555 [Terriglobales bacterium]